MDEDYLTYVCANTNKNQIPDLLKTQFVDAMICGKEVDCHLIDSRVFDILLDQIEFGLSVDSQINSQKNLDLPDLTEEVHS